MEPIAIRVGVSGHDATDRVEVRVDDGIVGDLVVGSATTLELESAPVYHGVHVVSAVPYDLAGNAGSATVGDIFVNTGPSIPGGLRVASQASGAGPITFAFVESRELQGGA